MCPGTSDLFYVVTYYIKWVTNSWTYCIVLTPAATGWRTALKFLCPTTTHARKFKTDMNQFVNIFGMASRPGPVLGWVTEMIGSC